MGQPMQLFRIFSVAFSGLVAFLLPAAFAFHQEWGTLWGVALAAVVQLSTPWVPAKGRLALVAPEPTKDVKVA